MSNMVRTILLLFFIGSAFWNTGGRRASSTTENTDHKGYYKILEVSTDASQNAIKKAYRKQALAWHPDKNKSPGAEAQFKKIAEAYEVLGDEQKRRRYDMGESAFSFNMGGMDPFDMFKDFFGGDDPFADFGFG